MFAVVNLALLKYNNSVEKSTTWGGVGFWSESTKHVIVLLLKNKCGNLSHIYPVKTKHGPPARGVGGGFWTLVDFFH